MDTPSILIVDDEEHIRMTLEETLASDYDTITAATGAEATRCVDEHTPALVLLDLKLPDIDGLEVLGHIEERHPEIPVIMITAHGSVDAALTAMEVGAHSFIEKPFSPEQIRRVVAHALDPDRQASERATSYDEYLREALASLEEKQLDAAVEHARRAVALDATRPEGFNVLGVLMQLRGQLHEARRHFQTALALNPGYEPAQRNQENLSQSPPRRSLSQYRIE